MVCTIATSKTSERRLKQELRTIFQLAEGLSTAIRTHPNSFSVLYPQANSRRIIHFDAGTMSSRRCDGPGGGRIGEEVGLLIFPQLLHGGECLVAAKVICTSEITRYNQECDSGCGFIFCGIVFGNG